MRNPLSFQKTRERRRDSQDRDVPRQGAAKTERIALGVALLQRVALPGVRYTYDEIAAWAGCTEVTIKQIEFRALKKLRSGSHSGLMKELAEHLHGGRAIR